MRILGLGIGCASLATALGAAAQVEQIQLEYQADETHCPASNTFEAEVRARTAKAGFAEQGRRFTVRIERGEAGFVGQLRLSETDGTSRERAIDGADCAEVVSALALIAALAVDPNANTAPRAELEVPTAEPVALATPEPAARAEPAPAPSRPTASRPARATEPPTEPARPRRVGWSFGLGASVISGPAPEPLIALGPESELRSQAGTNVWSFRFAALAAQTGTLGPSHDRARFRWLVERLGACPLGQESWLRLRACALAEGGVLAAEGQSVDVAGSATRAWLALGAGGVVGLRPISRIYVDLQAAALVHLRRDRFVFESPRRVVYEVPAVGFGAGLSVGWLVR